MLCAAAPNAIRSSHLQFARLAMILVLVGGFPRGSRGDEGEGATAAVDAASRAVLTQCRRATFDSETYWTSQPGALRSFERGTGQLRTLYKLYSSAALSVSNLAELEADRPSDWASRPGHFVDLNEPIAVDGGLVYPIADPRADAEGFSFTPAEGANPLPFPVAWLYLTRDGTLGSLDASNRFVPVLNPRTGVATAATADNPLVARVAWWADDATCKININTASEGVFWDSPRCDTAEERAYAQYQPARGEWQRDMGHPAAVCLSSVLFPGHRLHLPDTSSRLQPLPLATARLLWQATPGVPDAGTLGGTVVAPYTAAGAVNEEVATLHQSPTDPATWPDVPEEARSRLAKGSFFLTAHSRGLESTRDGLPRVSLWPIRSRGATWSQLSYRNPSPVTDTEVDCLMAWVSTLHTGGEQFPLAVVRSDPNSRSSELYQLQDGSIYKLGQTLLHAWSALDHPAGSFAAKYGESLNSDSGCLLASVIDYIRQTNLREPELNAAWRYLNTGSDYPRVSPLVWAGGAALLAERANDATDPFPMGIGTEPVVTEVALLIALRNASPAGQPIANGTFYGDNQVAAVARGAGFDHYEIEVGLLVELFIPAQTARLKPPDISFTLGGKAGSALAIRVPNSNGTAIDDLSIGDLTLSGKPLVFPGFAAERSVSIPNSARRIFEWGGYVGTLGVRHCESLIAFKPILFSVPPGSPLPAFSFSGTQPTAQDHLRLIQYPANLALDVTRGLAAGILTRVIPLAFPPILNSPFELPSLDPNPVPLTNPSATGGRAAGKGTRLARARSGVGALYGDNGLIHTGHDIVISLVPNHGDFRLLAGKVHATQGYEVAGGSNQAREYPTFVAHPNYGVARLAHSLTESWPASNRIIRNISAYTHADLATMDDGYFARGGLLLGGASTPLHLDSAVLPDFPVKPWETLATPVTLFHPLGFGSLTQGAILGGEPMTRRMPMAFAATRYDGLSTAPSAFDRGAARPDLTGDFDNGLAATMDGPYINFPDSGEALVPTTGGIPYFDWSEALLVANPGTFSPYRHVPSAMMLGSLPTGVLSNVPWQTLLFRPDPARGTASAHFGGTGWPDHLIADFFRMPVVKPSSAIDWSDPEAAWKPSDTFSTEGRININYQLIPFNRVHRATALHALLKAQKLLAIPDEAGAIYKAGAGVQPWRRHIDTAETLRQWEARFAAGDVFHTSSEIADQWLVPEGVRLEDVPAFWTRHRLTGDNSKERPYANIYPHLTTKSLVYELHIVAEEITKGPGTPDDTFVGGTDSVSPRVRVTTTVRGKVDTRHPDLPNYARAGESPTTRLRPLDTFVAWSADATLPVSAADVEPRWAGVEPNPSGSWVELTWASAPGHPVILETTTDGTTWTTEGRFETGFWVDTIRGESRLHERLNTTLVKLAVPPGTSALYARLRWSPPEGG